jgi:AraC-like DNA-binding protein
VGAGHAFFILPGEEHWYRADAAEPWWYGWVGFSAPAPEELARWMDLPALPLVFRVVRTAEAEHLLDQLLGALGREQRGATGLEAGGLAFQLLEVLAETQRTRHEPADLAESAREFMRRHFAENIRVQDIANALNTHRSHLSRVFASGTGETPKHYLTRLRMEEAARILTGSDRPVAQVATLVGYPEYQSFVNQFRRWFGTTPSAHRTASP